MVPHWAGVVVPELRVAWRKEFLGHGILRVESAARTQIGAIDAELKAVYLGGKVD